MHEGRTRATQEASSSGGKAQAKPPIVKRKLVMLQVPPVRHATAAMLCAFHSRSERAQRHVYLLLATFIVLHCTMITAYSLRVLQVLNQWVRTGQQSKTVEEDLFEDEEGNEDLKGVALVCNDLGSIRTRTRSPWPIQVSTKSAPLPSSHTDFPQ